MSQKRGVAEMFPFAVGSNVGSNLYDHTNLISASFKKLTEETDNIYKSELNFLPIPYERFSSICLFYQSF